MQYTSPINNRDTVVVSAKRETFEEIFIAKNCWSKIPMSGKMHNKIKYLAVYQTHPVSAITHFAPVERIERYLNTRKYILYFSDSPKELKPPVIFVPCTNLQVQGPRYTTLEELTAAKYLTDLW